MGPPLYLRSVVDRNVVMRRYDRRLASHIVSTFLVKFVAEFPAVSVCSVRFPLTTHVLRYHTQISHLDSTEDVYFVALRVTSRT